MNRARRRLLRETIPSEKPQHPRKKARFHKLAVLKGRYQLHRPVGAGGMGSVYMARDLKSGNDVAVKIAHPETRQGDQLENNILIRREAIALARLRHRNIVRLLDQGTCDGRAYMVLEHLGGETLADFIGRRSLVPFRRIISIMLQLCDALQAVHDAEMAHSDVKPMNVMLLEKDHELKLLDFGIAHFTNPEYAYLNLEDDGSARGTPMYMSPEQASGYVLEEYPYSTDIHAAGTIMYEMLTGRNPFYIPDSTGKCIMRMVLEERPDHPSNVVDDIPPLMEDIVMVALEKHPEERFSSMGMMKAALLLLKHEKP